MVAGIIEGTPAQQAGLLHGATALYLARYLNVPPASVPGEDVTDLTNCPPGPGRSALLCSMPLTASGRLMWRPALSPDISFWVVRRRR